MSTQSRTQTASARAFGVACARCATFIAIDYVASSGLAHEFCAPCPACGIRGMYGRADLAQARK